MEGLPPDLADLQWTQPGTWIMLFRELGWPGILLAFAGLAWRFKPTPGAERKPWVFRVEVAFSEDTLVRIAAMVKRMIYGKRPAPVEEEQERTDDDPTPEVVVQRGHRGGRG